MTCLEWSRQTTALREGRLRLLAPEEDGLSMYARRSFDDFREYVKALEHGYRKVCEDLDLYRKQERVRPAVRAGDMSLQELVENQWSDAAALGYAAMAMIQDGLSPSAVVGVLERMEEIMDAFERSYAAEFHKGLLDGVSDAEAQAPEWIGASAELKPEVPSC